MNLRLQRVMWWARQGLLTGGAVLGVLCILVTVGAGLFGLRPLVFQSGSMSPTIDTGALAIAHEVDASSLRPGQIVSVPTDGGERVTHRIVTATMDGEETAELTLRGDANSAVDAHAYRVTHADRVLFDLPLVGYAIGWMVGPAGLFLLGLYAAFLLSVLLKGSPGERPPVPPARDDADTSEGTGTSRKVLAGGLSVVLLTGAAAGLLLQRQITPTLAAFTDPVGVSGTKLTSTLPAPSGMTCVKGTGQRVTLTWAAVTGATYVVYDDGVPLPQTTLTYSTANKDFGVLWVTAVRNFSGQQWTSPDSVHYSYTKSVCVAL